MRPLHERIITDYFATTSSAGHTGKADYAKATVGLARGLVDWFDVKGKVVVDLGCGTGELCWLAKKHGASRVVGVNLSEGEIAYASEYVDAEFVHQDILAYLSGCSAESIDRIFALNILEHLAKDTLGQVLEQAARVLRPKGTLVAMVPNAISPFGTMTRYWDITHHLAFTPSSVRQLMRLAGFAEADFREWGPRPHGVFSTIRFLLWQGIRAATAFRLMVELGSAKGGVYTVDMIFRLTKA